MVDNDQLVIDSGRINDSGQNLYKSKKASNLVKFRKSKNYPKLSKSIKTILNKSKNLVNLTMAINANAMRYPIARTRVVFTYLKQMFIKILIFRYFDLEYHT